MAVETNLDFKTPKTFKSNILQQPSQDNLHMSIDSHSQKNPLIPSAAAVMFSASTGILPLGSFLSFNPSPMPSNLAGVFSQNAKPMSHSYAIAPLKSFGNIGMSSFHQNLTEKRSAHEANTDCSCTTCVFANSEVSKPNFLKLQSANLEFQSMPPKSLNSNVENPVEAESELLHSVNFNANQHLEAKGFASHQWSRIVDSAAFGYPMINPMFRQKDVHSSIPPPVSSTLTPGLQQQLQFSQLYLANLKATAGLAGHLSTSQPTPSTLSTSLPNQLLMPMPLAAFPAQVLRVQGLLGPNPLGFPQDGLYPSEWGPVGRRKNATRETTAALKNWLGEHLKNPYPTKGEKVMLAIITKMTLTQVSTWFANARRRLKKEGKMTWTPRNTYEDEEDECADEVGEDLSTLERDSFPDDDSSHFKWMSRHENLEKSSSRKRKIGSLRKGIWSIVDVATKEQAINKDNLLVDPKHSSPYQNSNYIEEETNQLEEDEDDGHLDVDVVDLKEEVMHHSLNASSSVSVVRSTETLTSSELLPNYSPSKSLVSPGKGKIKNSEEFQQQPISGSLSPYIAQSKPQNPHDFFSQKKLPVGCHPMMNLPYIGIQTQSFPMQLGHQAFSANNFDIELKHTSQASNLTAS